MIKDSVQKVFWGWWIVGVCSLVSLYGVGTFHYGFGVLVKPIVSELGWSMVLASGAFSLYRLDSGIMAPLAGYLVDRIGPRKVVTLGAILMGTGYICLSQVRTVLPFYLSFLIISTGFGFSTSNIVGTTLISKWFIRKRGKAIGLYFGLQGIGGFLVPIIAHLVILYGWRTFVLILGPVTWLIVLPFTPVLRRRPEEHGLLPDGGSFAETPEIPSMASSMEPREINFSVKEAISTPSYWLLAVCFSAFQMTNSAIFVHLVPYLLSVGFEVRRAAFVVSSITAGAILGRMGFGWVSDVFGKRMLLMICFLMQFIGILILIQVRADASIFYTIFFILAFGCTYGGLSVLRPATVAEFYGRDKFGTIWGFLQGISVFGGIAGPVVVGLIYDLQQVYRLGLVFLCFVNLLAFFLAMFLKRPVMRKEAEDNHEKLAWAP